MVRLLVTYLFGLRLSPAVERKASLTAHGMAAQPVGALTANSLSEVYPPGTVVHGVEGNV